MCPHRILPRSPRQQALPAPVDPPGRRGSPCSPATSETRPRSPVKPSSPKATEEFPPQAIQNGNCISRSY